MKRIALILTLCAAGLPGWADEARRLITVTGEGQVQMAPDMALISLGVTHQAPEAQVAMAQATEAAAAVLARLKEAGIAPRDVQTSQVNLWPVYSERSSGTPQTDGFRAELTMSVRVRDLSALSGILAAVAQDGANRFSGLQFALSQPQEAEDAARQVAVADALRKARLYAQAAGGSVGQVVSISESGEGNYPQMRMAADQGSGAAIAEGELTISEQVTVVIELR